MPGNATFPGILFSGGGGGRSALVGYLTLDDEAIAAARDVLQQLRTAGVNLATVTDQLEREGVEGFCDPYRQLLACIDERAGC